MGRVLTLLKVYADEGFTNEQVIEKLKEVKGFNTVKEEPVAFGIKCILASFVCDDKEGTDYEAMVEEIEGVGSVNVEECGLVS